MEIVICAKCHNLVAEAAAGKYNGKWHCVDCLNKIREAENQNEDVE